MIGIKGSGMSALACILHDSGYEVEGSDTTDTLFTEESLRARNISMVPFHVGNIQPHHTVIAGNAFKDDHEEVQQAKKVAKRFYRYHEFLGDWLGKFTSIAISGAHGKTSTTGMMSTVFSDVYPTSFLIGDGTGKGVENASHFVFEACEYRRHFHAYQPDYAVVTNIDFDHPDYFHSLEDVQQAFIDFAQGVKKALIVCGDNREAKKLSDTKHIPTHTYGLHQDNDVQARNIQVTNGHTTFELWKNEKLVQPIMIPLVGVHHIQNSLAVLTIAMLENLPLEIVQASFMAYKGVKRRFQVLQHGDVVVVDDYAHHPTEIKATIETARLAYPTKKVVAVFQPHTFTRTKQFLREFGESLSLADQAYLCPIFGSAREQSGELSIQDLQSIIPNAKLVEDVGIDGLREESNAVLLFMGAGDIQKYERSFLATACHS